FTSGTLDSSVWSRFTDNFGELTVIARSRLIGKLEHSHRSAQAQRVMFDLCIDIRGGYDYIKRRKYIEAKLLHYIAKSDFIIIRMPSSIGLIASRICVKLGKKYIVELVGSPFDSLWYYGGVITKIIAPFNSIKHRKAVGNASAVVYVTKSYLQDRYPNLNYCLNASNVVIEDFDESVLDQHIEFLTRAKTSSVLGMIGNIELPYKGYKYLFRALVDVIHPFEFHIVGGGDPKWIRSLIKQYNLGDKIVLRGRINSREEMYAFLDSLDLYIQPSMTEGLPRGVIE